VAVPDGAARGAAYVARMAAGLETSLNDSDRWAGISRRIEPDPTWAKATRARYRQFCEVGAGN
jgi:xylulokinase